MTQLFVLEDIAKFPGNLADTIRAYCDVDESHNVMMDAHLSEGGSVVYSRDSRTSADVNYVSQDGTAWLHPAVLILDGGRKVYPVEEKPHRGQDASDLEMFQEIIIKARKGEEKDAETCSAVTIIYEQFVSYLCCLNYASVGSDNQIRARRGRIQTAKYTACRIWRDGKLKKEEKKEVIDDKA